MSATFIFPFARFKSIDAIELDTCLCGLGSLKILVPARKGNAIYMTLLGNTSSSVSVTYPKSTS
jgi:hypothetical protein